MEWKDVANIVKKAAPLLGSVLGGPAGGAVGGLVATALGADPDNPDDVISKIEKDSKATEKLQELELKHKERLEELKIEEAKIRLEGEKARLADVQSARAREITLAKAGKLNWFQYGLAGLVVLGFFVLTIYLIAEGLDVGVSALSVLNLLFGALVSGFASVLAYFFGSSRGSAEKTGLLSLRQSEKPTSSPSEK